MIARLGFAIATDVDPDILIVDEILGVGDDAFQAKCRRRIENFRAKGVTILFVSHDLKQVEEMCDYVYWLDHGEIRANGRPEHVVARIQGIYGATSRELVCIKDRASVATMHK